MGQGKTWISSSRVTCMSVGMFSPSTSVRLLSALEWSMEQWLWPRVSPWNCCSDCLIWAEEILPFLAGEGTVCLGSKRSVQWTNMYTHTWVDVFLFCFFPSLEVTHWVSALPCAAPRHNNDSSELEPDLVLLRLGKKKGYFGTQGLAPPWTARQQQQDLLQWGWAATLGYRIPWNCQVDVLISKSMEMS